MQFLLRRAHLVSNWCARSHLAASQRKLQPRSFANSFRRTSCSSQGFEEWIARNPPPDSSKPHSWVVETVAASVPCAAGPLVQKLQGALQSASQKYSFHWDQTSALVAALQRTHDIAWCGPLGGYLCSPSAAMPVATDDDLKARVKPEYPIELQNVSQYNSGPMPVVTHQILLLEMPQVLYVGNSDNVASLLKSNPTGALVPGQQLIALLSADSAALGICSGGALNKHKTFTGYTVRKCQGGSQLKHLRSGGGGRSVGGRIRIRETRRLFEAVAARLCEWQDDIKGSSLLMYSGGVRVWNEVFSALGADPFLSRRDARWQKVARSVSRPRLKDLQRTANSIKYGAVTVLDVQ